MKDYKTCIIRLGSYPDDPRVRKQVDALLKNNFKIDLICTRLSKNQPLIEKYRNLRILRLPFNKSISNSIFMYIVLYVFSLLIITSLITILTLFNRYQTIQIHTLPDFLTFSTIIPKLLGVKIITDFHEPTPELIMTKLGDKKKFLIATSIKIEQLVLKYSDLSFTVTDALKNRYVERGACRNKIKVITNVVDDHDFVNARNLRNKKNDDFIIITHGSIEKRYGHELVILAINELKKIYPSIKFYICGFGSYESELKKLTAELQCEEQVKFFGYLPHEELLTLLANSDTGIISMPKNPYSELIETNKLYEYIALGLPVIHSRLEPVEKHFSDNSIMYYEPGNLDDLKKAIEYLYNYPNKRIELVKNADLVYADLRWPVIQNQYVNSIKNYS